MIEILPTKKRINAEIFAPPSKAHTLRAFFIASLAKGKSILKNPLLGEDQGYAISALEKFGAKFKILKNKIIVQGTGGKLKVPKEKIYIGNSGVSARFLTSYASLIPKGKVIIDGSERMRENRPIKELILSLKKLGVEIKSLEKQGYLPIEVKGGGLKGGKTYLSGSISSQFFSSILISAPYAKKDVIVKCKGDISSKPYIDITIQTMKDFGVEVENQNYKRFQVKAGQSYKAREYSIEGDFTNASYFFCACAILKGRIKIKNLNYNSTQGDKIFVDILKDIGCEVKKGEDFIELKCMKDLRPIKIDMNSYPDLVPTLAILLSTIKGKSEIYNVYHLRFKESDRIKALVNELSKIGVDVKEKKDGIVINGNPKNFHNAEIECYNDHRIAMAFSILGLKVPGIIIKDERCTNKSFPNFYEVFKKINGRFKEIKR